MLYFLVSFIACVVSAFFLYIYVCCDCNDYYHTRDEKKIDNKKKSFKEKLNKYYDFAKATYVLWTAIFVIFTSCLVFGSICLGINYGSAKSELASQQAKYDVIMYQLENRMYSTVNDAGQIREVDSNGNLIDTGKVVVGYGQRELMKDVQDWNSWLSSRNTMEKNIIMGWFYPKFSDKLEMIDLYAILGDNNPDNNVG